MNRIKTYLNSLGRTTRTSILALAVVFVSAGIAQAATTISTDVTTGGALSVTGLSTLLGGATTTQITFLSGDTIKNATASSTVLSGRLTSNLLTVSGAATLSSTLAVTGAATLSSTLAVTGATTLSASTTVGTATLFAGDDLNRVGVGTTTPLDIFMVEHQTATTTIVVSTGAAAKGGRIILEDIDGDGCSEISALDGTLTAKTVTCPTGI